MTYTDEFLISELHRFYDKFEFVPTQLIMNETNGYPTAYYFVKCFGSWNNALKVAGFKLNQYCPKLDGTETCTYCGKRADEIPNFTGWVYHGYIRYCRKHGGGNGLRNYVTGNLDINSNTGLGRAGEILVAKTLKIGNEHDCNRISCGYSFDMYHEQYGKIDVKTSLFNYEYNKWAFELNKENICDTYICIGLSSGRSVVQHVWVVPNEGYIRNKTGLAIYDTHHSLSTHEHWEVYSTTYNNVWQEMIINYQNDGCKVFK